MKKELKLKRKRNLKKRNTYSIHEATILVLCINVLKSIVSQMSSTI